MKSISRNVQKKKVMNCNFIFELLTILLPIIMKITYIESAVRDVLVRKAGLIHLLTQKRKRNLLLIL